jgi:hypothetical protein
MVLHDDPDAVQIIIHFNGVGEPSAAEVAAMEKENRRCDAEATKAMNRLQDALVSHTSLRFGITRKITPIIGLARSLDARCPNQLMNFYAKLVLTFK